MSATQSYLSIAADQASLSDMRIKHGSCVVRGGKVIGLGHNSTRNQFQGRLRHLGLPKRLQSSEVCSLHSEVVALLNAVGTEPYFKACSYQDSQAR